MGAGGDPGEVVDGLVGEAEVAVCDGVGGVGGGVDGVDAGSAMGVGLVAEDGEVHGAVEVVAAVWVVAAQGGDVEVGDGVGGEVEDGDGGGDLAVDGAAEPGLVLVVVPGAGLVGEEGVARFDELNVGRRAAEDLVEFLVKGVVGGVSGRAEEIVDGCIGCDGVDEVGTEIAGHGLVALERSGEKVCVDRGNEDASGRFASDVGP